MEAVKASELMDLFDRHPMELAPALLGCEFIVTTERGTVAARLTEVEAYGDQGEDPGAHSYRGRTARNASLFGPPRRVYLYRSYGIHTCVNLVAHATGAGGVLLRAAEVVTGRLLAVERRGGRDTGVKLLSGPGRLGQGLGVMLSQDGSLLEIGDSAEPESADGRTVEDGVVQGVHTPNGGARFLLSPPEEPLRTERISCGPRVGVSGIGGSRQFPWRFWLHSERSVSAYRPGRNVPVLGEGPG